MKNLRLVIGIVVILAVVCSPVLAISMNDLIASYKGEPALTKPAPTPSPSTLDVYPDPYSFRWFDVLYSPVAATLVPSYYIKINWSSIESLLRPPTPYPDGPIKKPNIYLYSDRDLTAQVRLTPESAITVSDPVYQPGKGWLAQVWDGSLNGNGDFLFYEALVPDSGWQKEEGYVIRAAYREQDMGAMLGPYGFNEKETVEFIEYWASHLIGDVDYVFYPLETDAVERVMPLLVSPKPDHVMRIWFYAEPLVSAPEPVTHPEKIVREGFYVVEWGVFIDDEYEINHSAASSEVVNSNSHKTCLSLKSPFFRCIR